MSRFAWSCVAVLSFSALTFAADAETGTLKVPADDAKANIAERFRMEAFSAEYKLALRYDLKHSGVTVYDLTFPSPVKSDIPENNTVYAQYFMPKTQGKVPAVVVLDIMQGN